MVPRIIFRILIALTGTPVTAASEDVIENSDGGDSQADQAVIAIEQIAKRDLGQKRQSSER